MDDALDLVLAKLDGVRQHGGYWMARCPAHDDNTASMSVARGTEQPVVFKCHAGCDRDLILDALGLSLQDVSKPAEERRQFAEWTPHGDAIAVYDYTDEAGALLFQVLRTARKQFPQRKPDRSAKSGWSWKLNGVRRVPYRLPKILAAIRDGKTIYITEGEKDVHAIEAAGGVATCNPGGAGKWVKDYARLFRDADVIIVQDKDDPGRTHGAQVAASLDGTAASVVIVEAVTGKDAADHLAAGYGLDEFVPAAEDHLAGIAGQYTPVDWAEVWQQQPDGIDWLIDQFLEAGTVNALFAKPGTGKSLIALELALRLVRDGAVVVYIDDENRVIDLVERLQAFGAQPQELGNLRMYSFAGLPPLDSPAGGLHLEAIAATADASLVVLDTTSRMVQGKENDSDTFLQLYRCSLVPLKARGITVLRLDHPGKDESRGQRGSSAKDGDVDTIWRLTKETETEFHLQRSKSRSSHGPEAITLRRRFSPLRHDWSAGGLSVMSERFRSVIQVLDGAGVPLTAGRPTVRKAMETAGVTAQDSLLNEVIKYRKNCAAQASHNPHSSTSEQLCGSNELILPHSAQHLCDTCGTALDKKLAAAGFTTHPGCENRMNP